jgi:hypothetical protein
MEATMGLIICGLFACLLALGVKAGEENNDDDDDWL